MSRIHYNAETDRLELLTQPVHVLRCGEIVEAKIDGVWRWALRISKNETTGSLRYL